MGASLAVATHQKRSPAEAVGPRAPSSAASIPISKFLGSDRALPQPWL
ncbi:MAG: hypothetical protein AAGF11_43430 [Myxococcota bacterium]